MEQSESRKRDERWLDLLYGCHLEPESGLLIAFGGIVLGLGIVSMAIGLASSQLPVESLTGMILGLSFVSRWAASLLYENRRHLLARTLRLFSALAMLAMLFTITIGLYSSFGLLVASIFLVFLVGIIVLLVRRRYTRAQRGG